MYRHPLVRADNKQIIRIMNHHHHNHLVDVQQLLTELLHVVQHTVGRALSQWHCTPATRIPPLQQQQHCTPVGVRCPHHTHCGAGGMHAGSCQNTVSKGWDQMHGALGYQAREMKEGDTCAWLCVIGKETAGSIEQPVACAMSARERKKCEKKCEKK